MANAFELDIILPATKIKSCNEYLNFYNPHSLSCNCGECQQYRELDQEIHELEYALKRIKERQVEIEGRIKTKRGIQLYLTNKNRSKMGKSMISPFIIKNY
jgi:hypothetical protein